MLFHVSEGGLDGLLPSPRRVHGRPRAMATSGVTSTLVRSPSDKPAARCYGPRAAHRGYALFPAPAAGAGLGST